MMEGYDGRTKDGYDGRRRRLDVVVDKGDSGSTCVKNDSGTTTADTRRATDLNPRTGGSTST